MRSASPGASMLKRDTGKLVFVMIAQRGAEVQLFISKAVIGDEGLRRGQGGATAATGWACTAR